MLALALALPTGIVAAAIVTWIRIGARRHGQPACPADAIVVFGAGANPTGPGPELQARVDHAARLYERGHAPTILCSGGMSGGVVSEPGAMRDALLGMGVPPEAIRVDEGGTSTRRTLASARELGRVLLVSSPYHMHRIVNEARRQGVDAVPSPAPSSPDMETPLGLAYGLREVAAVWWYALRARLA